VRSGSRVWVGASSRVGEGDVEMASSGVVVVVRLGEEVEARVGEEVEARGGLGTRRSGVGEREIAAFRFPLDKRFRSVSFSFLVCVFFGWLLLPRKSGQLLQSPLYTSSGFAGMFAGRGDHDLNFSLEGIP
jgi:hypothetical protein